MMTPEETVPTIDPWTVAAIAIMIGSLVLTVGLLVGSAVYKRVFADRIPYERRRHS